MTSLSAAIADFNEQHGITGVIIDGRSITNEELRQARPPFGREAWAQAAMGRTFKRPKGTVEYTIRRVESVLRSHLTFVECVCDTQYGERRVAASELMKMEMIA